MADFIRQTAGVDLLNAALVTQHIAPDLSYLEPLLLKHEGEVADLSYLDPILLGDGQDGRADGP